jgi:hypothetical protein
MFRNKTLPVGLSLVVLAACANTGANYEPIIDGTKGENYATDLAACQSLAASNTSLDESAVRNTATGAVVAGASSAIFNGNSDDLGEAVAVGALAGIAASGLNNVNEKENIVKNCMRGRGYNVIG